MRSTRVARTGGAALDRRSTRRADATRAAGGARRARLERRAPYPRASRSRAHGDATRRATRALARALGERAVEARAPTGGSTVPGRARALSIASSASARVGEAGVMPASMRVERRWWKKANRRVEVILRAPVSGLGDVDEVARVRPGRARNHLVPGKLATYVNAEKLAAARERLAARERARIEAGGEDGDEAAATAQEEEHKRKVRSDAMGEMIE